MHPSIPGQSAALGLTLALACVVALPAGAALGRGRPESPGPHGQARASAAHGAAHGKSKTGPGVHGRSSRAGGQAGTDVAVVEPAFVAQVQPVGVAGSFLNIRAKVKVHGPKDPSVAFEAVALVGFASGEVVVPLARMGRSLVARALVPVAPDETPGPVVIRVDVTYGAVVEAFDLTTDIKAPGAGETAGEPEVPEVPEVEEPEVPEVEVPEVEEPEIEEPEVEAPVVPAAWPSRHM